MVDEQPVGPGLEHIHPATVAANLGLTTGAIYHHWESLDDYRDELLEELLAAERFTAVTSFDESAIADLADEQSLAALIAVITETDWRSVIEDHRRLRSNLGLWARDEDDVTERLAAQYRHLAKGWTAVIDDVLVRFDLEPRPPMTMDGITSVLSALVEGLVVRTTTEPEAAGDVTGPDDEAVSLFSAAAAAFLSGAIRRRDGRPLWQHVDETIGRPEPA